MKIKYRHIIDILISMAFVLLLTGCSSDSEQNSRPMRDMNLVLGAQNYTDATDATTRGSLPDNYVLYDNMTPRVPMDFAMIRAFMTHDINIDFQGDFTYRKVDDKYVWNSKVPLDEGTYYVYGFMPSSEVNKVHLVPLLNSGNSTTVYSNGAVMTITGLSAVTACDPCVIVGVKGAPTNTEMPDLADRLGYYDFNADKTIDGGGEYIYLLIDHLYAGLYLRMDINSTYNELRTIKITKLTLKAKHVKNADMTVTMKQGDATSLNSIGIAPYRTVGDEITIYDGEERELKVNETENFMACILPILEDTDNREYEMKTTYNVYDRKGNLIGPRTVVNALTIPASKTLSRGQYYTFNLTVNPTYIYVLSEPDLDNPMVVINE